MKTPLAKSGKNLENVGLSRSGVYMVTQERRRVSVHTREPSCWEGKRATKTSAATGWRKIVNVDASDTRISSTRQRNPVGSICRVPWWCFTLTSRRASSGFVFARWIFIVGKLEPPCLAQSSVLWKSTRYFIGIVNTSLPYVRVSCFLFARDLRICIFKCISRAIPTGRVIHFLSSIFFLIFYKNYFTQ